MPEFNLDQFKKTWQEQEVQSKYDRSDIESMLNKSSRNYVKYILWISVAEFLLILGLNIYYLIWGNNSDSFMNLLEKLGVQETPIIEANFAHLYFGLKVISLALTALFVFLFYRNYVQIKVESNLKKLILQIIRFKRTVNLFIIANIGLMLFYAIALTTFTFYTLSSQNIQLDQPTLIGFYLGIALMIIISIVIIWFYYRIIYGILLKKLTKNLVELKKIEEEKI